MPSKDIIKYSSYVILSLITIVSIRYIYDKNNKKKKYMKFLTYNDISNEILLLEERIQKDEGKRGIIDILPPKGELLKSAEEILKCNKLVIITGFPCMISYTPPTETDGPLGALCIARSALAIGKEVIILTDECNEESMLAATAGSELCEIYGNKLSLESFPCTQNFDESDFKRLLSIQNSSDLIIAIERTGPTKDGSYRTMSGIL